MTLDKAIEILTIELSAFPQKGTDEWYDAVELGIEALKLIKQIHIADGTPSGHLLPGETPE